MRSLLLFAALVVPATATAQAPDAGRRTIDVTGTAEVETPPDVATLSYTVVGEGRTADEATTALAARNKAVAAGVTGLLGGRTTITVGNVNTAEARGPQCERYGSVRLSEGVCATTGYVATLVATVRTPAVAKVGTAAALISRLGGREARLTGLALADPAAARGRAASVALAEARARAMALAAGLGGRIGAVLTVRDTQAMPTPDIIVTAHRGSVPPPPPPPPPPIEIDLTPHPVTTRAQVFVTFALED